MMTNKQISHEINLNYRRNDPKKSRSERRKELRATKKARKNKL